MRNEQIVFSNPGIPVFSRKCSGNLSDFHFHSELELIHISSGAIILETEGEKIHGKKGEIIFINSNVSHATVKVDEKFSGELVQFRLPSQARGNLRYLYKFFKSLGTPSFLFSNSKDSEILSECIADILDKNGTEDAADEYFITSKMYMIISVLYKNNLLENSEKLIKNTKEIERLLPVLEYIDAHYSESIALSDLSAVLNLNEYYFCRIFKKAMGSTATDYINFVRTYYASKLLFTKKSILDICCETGFSSLSYFNRTFKKYFQYPPSVYKKIAKRPDNLI